MYLTVYLKPAKDADARRDPAAVDELLRSAADVGALLEPLDHEDLRLASSFTAEVPDRAAAERAIERISRNEIVETAYLKSGDALP